MDEFLEILKQNNAYWKFEKGGLHIALFGSGSHSDKLCDFFRIEENPVAVNEIAKLLAKKIKKEAKCTDFSEVIIIASDVKSASFGRKLAEELRSKFAFCFKPKGSEGSLQISDFDLNKKIIIFDRIFTYGGSVKRALETIKNKNPKAKFVLLDKKIIVASLVFRHVLGQSSLNVDPQFKVITLLKDDAYIWLPEECPLCMKGSRALDLNDPKQKKEFQKLY